jgi:hypothetical protein
MKLSRLWAFNVLSLGGLALGASTLTTGSVAVTTMGGCSSNNSSSSGGATSSSSGSSSGSTSSGGTEAGACMSGCTFPTSGTIAARLDLDTGWMGTNVIQGCDPNLCSDPKQRAYLIIIALNYTISDPSTGKYTGTLKTCHAQNPPVTLTDTGAALVGEPSGTQVLVTPLDSAWDSPNQPTINITGTLASTGGVLKLDSIVTLDGIKQSSSLGDATKMWPPPAASNSMMPAIALSDLSNDDGNGYGYGISAVARSDMGFFVPRVMLSMTAPQADQLYLGLRTQFILDGCMTSCTEGGGTPQVPLLNNHVIGCHHQGGGDAASDYCTPAEYNFIDQNTTNFVTSGGTFKAKILTMGTGDGGTVSCADVRGAML